MSTPEIETTKQLYKEGLALLAVERFVDAEKCFNQVVQRLGESGVPRSSSESLPALRVSVNALRLQAKAVAGTGDGERASQLLGSLIERYGDCEDRRVGEAVARALGMRGNLYFEAGRYEAALLDYSALVEMARGSDSPELLEWVAIALVRKRVILRREGRYEEALEAADEALERFAVQVPPGWPVIVPDAFAGRIALLAKLGETEHALEACCQFIERYQEIQDGGEVDSMLASVMASRSELLLAADHPEDAIAAAGDFLARFDSAPQPELRTQTVRALRYKASAHGKLGCWEAALGLDDRALELVQYAHPGDRLHILAHRGLSLERLGKCSEALAAWEEAINRCREVDSPEAESILADVSARRAELLASTP